MRGSASLPAEKSGKLPRSTCVPHLLQALHFFVGFGALLSPLIADPFLSDTNCILSNSTANASSNLPHIRKSLVPHHPGNLSHYDLPMKGMVVTRVSYAFWIMALINVSAAAGVAQAVAGDIPASRLCRRLWCLGGVLVPVRWSQRWKEA